MKKHRLVWIVAITLVVVTLIRCGGSSGDSAKGREIYETGGAAEVPCKTCHTLDGTELVGPSFKGVATRAATRIPGMSAQDYIRQSIKQPSAYIVDGFKDQMPPIFGQTLSDGDINDLIALLMTIR